MNVSHGDGGHKGSGGAGAGESTGAETSRLRETQTFGPEHRLHKRAEFDAVFARGDKAAGRYFACYWLPRYGQGSRLGLVVSRKVGKAAKRNRVKRYLREFFRTHRTGFREDVDLVILARPPAAELNFQECAQALRRLLQGKVLDG